MGTRKPPIGASDYDTVFLLPSYTQKLKTEKPKARSVKVWDEDSVSTLQGLNVRTGRCLNASYINFCVDNVIPTKQTKTYVNTKPWVTADIKKLLTEKERAFKINDRCTGK